MLKRLMLLALCCFLTAACAEAVNWQTVDLEDFAITVDASAACTIGDRSEGIVLRYIPVQDADDSFHTALTVTWADTVLDLSVLTDAELTAVGQALAQGLAEQLAAAGEAVKEATLISAGMGDVDGKAALCVCATVSLPDHDQPLVMQLAAVSDPIFKTYVFTGLARSMEEAEQVFSPLLASIRWLNP